ncbi:Calpain-D [Eumeta japonica]|uniref:Calpain-D n=1 Tax=Eumeta variegata TaxID=151549 RepID=A0A4C1SV93_EUMVA|nr:Calpain-D [Eumeta japonica]
MGSIASVLQWHCDSCGQINPTESVKCLKCGVKRVSSHDGQRAKRLRNNSSENDTEPETNCEDFITEPLDAPVTSTFNSVLLKKTNEPARNDGFQSSETVIQGSDQMLIYALCLSLYVIRSYSIHHIGVGVICCFCVKRMVVRRFGAERDAGVALRALPAAQRVRVLALRRLRPDRASRACLQVGCFTNGS